VAPSGPLFASLGLAVTALLAAPACTVEAAGDSLPERAAPPAFVAISSAPDEVDGLDAIAGVWTWIDFPDSRCANGSPTGIAVNVRPGAPHLVIFLEGGGACASGEGCWVHPTAVNMASGYGMQQFASDSALELPLFQRGSLDNPLADASYVFVPYCTGDLHAGNGVASYDVNGQPVPTYHYGAHNLDLYLQKLGGSLTGIDHVWLVGESAGGFGTLFNQTFVARTFGARTDVIDDSGPGIGTSGYPSSWSVRLPPRCSTCAGGLSPLFEYDRGAYPAARFAFLSFQLDTALPGFYGATEDEVAGWLGAFEQSFAGLPGTRSFVAPGAGHVVMDPTRDAATSAAVSTWLTQMVTDDPSWSDVAPPGLRIRGVL
jgi:hypothetical protein